MALLDSYFNHLQARTGAQRFELVGDNASSRSLECVSPVRSTPTSPLQLKSVKRGPKFQPEKLEFNPPSPPKRMDSRDDLAILKPGFKRTLDQEPFKTPIELSSRFKSLFGAEIAARMASKQQTQATPERVELKALANLDAPKFPMRKGSRDDLSTLRSSQRRRAKFSNPDGLVNQRLDLSILMDEVISVIDQTSTRNLIRTGSS